MAMILQLDANGQPTKWISWQDATVYYAKKQIIWSSGSNEKVVHGGYSRLTGEQSIIKASSIVAVKGHTHNRKYHKVPALNNTELFRRDRHMCAYCGSVKKDSDLSRDHIMPRSRGGKDIWANVVTCCTKCNQHKDDHTLEEVGMKLLYVPYAPSYAEHLILANRNVLADQMEFLLSFIPDNSRIKEAIEEAKKTGVTFNMMKV